MRPPLRPPLRPPPPDRGEYRIDTNVTIDTGTAPSAALSTEHRSRRRGTRRQLGSHVSRGGATSADPRLERFKLDITSIDTPFDTISEDRWSVTGRVVWQQRMPRSYEGTRFG
jgi:hypothetical protein